MARGARALEVHRARLPSYLKSVKDRMAGGDLGALVCGVSVLIGKNIPNNWGVKSIAPLLVVVPANARPPIKSQIVLIR